ncbi:glycosyltransferase family 2 protein [Roseicella aquatilis]|uniref:Glycosyltransferase n=1 Tax=Roseicella aquatilis TaxID=2527868 RepID=A0A4R4D9N0_9PROT|nr:glycosyltransferase [Roseicella aquatilis]TCZ57273.1 glycosyltransferase [Roseicella aquatilis]
MEVACGAVARQQDGRFVDPLLSVVICTHNRPDDVLTCIKALLPQLAGTESSLVVVDSASSHAEREVLEAALANLPDVLRIRLEQPGLSAARNAGVLATASQWIAFLDDDAVPEPQWHARLLAVLRQVPETCGALGGRILPLFPEGQSPKLGARWKQYVSVNDAEGAWDCTEAPNVIGANLVFRRQAVQQAGGFATELGRYGEALLSGEEVVMIRRMRAAGWRIRYDSSFCVGHKVAPTRLGRGWVRARAYWEGISTVRIARLERDRAWPRLAMKVLLTLPLVGLLALLRLPGEWDFRLSFNCGVLAEALGLSRRFGG